MSVGECVCEVLEVEMNVEVGSGFFMWSGAVAEWCASGVSDALAQHVSGRSLEHACEECWI